MALQKQVIAALRQTGVAGPDSDEMARYLSGSENQRWAPIRAGGKPASEMIIKERDSRPSRRAGNREPKQLPVEVIADQSGRSCSRNHAFISEEGQ